MSIKQHRIEIDRLQYSIKKLQAFMNTEITELKQEYETIIAELEKEIDALRIELEHVKEGKNVK